MCMGPLISPLLPPPASPSNVVNLAEGTAVEIDGLLQRPDFNGKSGTANFHGLPSLPNFREFV